MKNLTLNGFTAMVFGTVMLSSCVKMKDVPAIPATEPDPIKMTVPGTFNYNTTVDVALNINLLTNDDKALAGVMVYVLDKPADENGSVLYTTISDADGKVTGNLKLPTYLKRVYVDASYIGLIRNAPVKIEGSNILATIGGAAGFGGNVDLLKGRQTYVERSSLFQRNMGDIPYNYIGNYSPAGVPKYLETKNDVISSSLLSYINASLPEGKPVPTYHPDYLKNTAETNINLKEAGDVWVTFVHEGAGYSNTLAYFTYPTSKPPTSVNDISVLNIVLPNASYSGSGGGMASGNKIRLGKFAANTSIGFCLIANGWSDNSHSVGSGLNKFFSIDNLNPETSTASRRHTVLLKDDTNNLFLIGFEDIRRDQSSDNDFNDLIFYVTSNPETAISTANVNAVDKPVDTDGDGVNDTYDMFPTDPLRAYINYYPSASTFSSVAFEDTWPNTGDYDLNDLIIDQQYKIINNGANKTVEIYANYVLRASGGSYGNGFGIQFPFASSAVTSVSGSRVTNGNIASIGTNGCETGQSKAVIIPFDNFFTVMSSSKGYINTDPNTAFVKPDTIKMLVKLASPLTVAQVGMAPFNPFIICNKTRGIEAHLPGELPTDKANKFLFNTAKDNTTPLLNRYYKTATNLPFGICIPTRFDYPIEGKSISSIYLNFVKWAESGGTSYPDWYQDSTGYRSTNYFYKP